MSEQKKFAIILSGCGVYDGSEIHEATLSMLAVARAGAGYELFAPDMEQTQVINHLTGQASQEKRNVLVESARIARGKISDLREYIATDYDALILPGGFGAAKNLSSFAYEGANCSVNPEVEKALRDTVTAGKPVGALCIAPVILARILKQATVTIGRDRQTAAAVVSMGGIHQPAGHAEVVIDEKYKIVTTPCYMLDATIDRIADGTEKMVRALIELM
ncbi:MAG: isoprenoid biosynthesis glyoxalase ElbB [Mangrovibacterium sp.]